MITVGSDFSGVGAFNQALNRLNLDYKEVFACDMDKYARQTFVSNYGEPEYYPENVYDREIPKESLDIYMTSPPCQAFSLAGNRKGESDKRGVLFYNSHEFIQKNKPRFFIFENVKGLLSDAKGRTFQIWLDMLGGKSVNGNPVIFPRQDSTPYHIYYKVLNAKHYGVPQNRERVFIVGIRDDADNGFNWPKPFPLKKRLKDVLESNVDEKYYLSDKMTELLSYNGKDKGIIGDLNKGDERGAVYSENSDVMNCLSATDYKQPKQIQVKSATKKGYEVATENDSINLSNPNSETRRGRVGKEVAQTLDTACNQAVMIGAIRGRNPENPLSRKVGLPTEQRLELNMNGTSNALTTVQKDNVVCELRKDEGIRYFKDNICGTIRTIDSGGDKHIIEYNNLSNTEKNTIFNGDKTIEDEKRNTYQILRLLCEEIGTKQVEAWGLRILETIREKEVLQQGLHEESLQRKTEEKTIGTNNTIQSSKSTRIIATIIMRSLPKEEWKRCSPQRRKSIKQLVRQLNESLQKLPFKNPQTEINMQSRKLQYENERFRILREALSKIQEIWESVNGQTQPIQQDYRIRRLTPREAFRLMDFPDTFKMPCSNSQMYKQAGNSIVVACLEQIISKLKL